MIYERLDEFMKGRANTVRWKDPEERERYLNERWKTSLVSTPVAAQDSLKGGLAAFNAFGDHVNVLKSPREKVIPQAQPIHSSGALPTATKKYKILLPSCLCIVSRYPFFKTFDRILRALYAAYTDFLEYPLEYYISSIACGLPLPPRGFYRISLQLGQAPNSKEIRIEQSLMNQLPILDVSFSLLPKHFSIENAIKLLNTMILEHNILFVCQDVQKLTPISESLMALLFPFDYQLIYIPVLPECMLEFLNSPVPFVAGVDKRFMKAAIDSVSPDTCIVNIDEGTVEYKGEEGGQYVGKKECGDLAALPKHEVDKLISRVSDNWYATLGNIWNRKKLSGGSTINEQEQEALVPKIRDSFLRVFVSIFRQYRDFIDERKINDPNFEKYFNKKKFLESLAKDYKPFVSQFIQTQIFQRFLDKKANPQRTEDMLQNRYFDENITCKSNRSLLSTSKVRRQA